MDIKYFDNAATTRIKEEVLEEMFPYLSVEYGNPSSVYSIGRKARKAIEEARKQVASLINCKSYEIYFTSCGSESDNTALKGLAYAQMWRTPPAKSPASPPVHRQRSTQPRSQSGSSGPALLPPL